jgi:hypothetical protein
LRRSISNLKFEILKKARSGKLERAF